MRASALAISTICRRLQRQVLDQRVGVDVVAADARQRVLGDAALRPAVDHAEARGRVGDDDVVGHRQIGDQREFLEDADDAGGVGGGGVGES